MAFTAIRYDIKPGCEEGLAEVFGDFKRTGSPVILDADGNDVGRIYGTALFIKDATMVRFILYEGRLEDLARHMATQPGVMEVERRLKPYLSKPRHTDTVEGFIATFMDANMRCLSGMFNPNTPASAWNGRAEQPAASGSPTPSG